jgi:hypothetical protein
MAAGLSMPKSEQRAKPDLCVIMGFGVQDRNTFGALPRFQSHVLTATWRQCYFEADIPSQSQCRPGEHNAAVAGSSNEIMLPRLKRMFVSFGEFCTQI